ncbi:sigma-70 family RNA polymerase sigma factor [Nocardiopsis coralli]|nr:sigma-70 family RNA polymerase sigma factor [Nocardiopsis coralli]
MAMREARTDTRNPVPQPRRPSEPVNGETLLADLVRVGSDERAAGRLRARIVQMYRPVVAREALRYRNRGVDSEELLQVGSLAMMKAIQGFDPSRGSRFVSYLLPMVSGEIKRHFRDTQWAVHVPRNWRDQRGALIRFVADFVHEHAREPTQSEIGAHFDLDPSETGAFINATSAYSAASLDTPRGTDEEGNEVPLASTIGSRDPDVESVVDRELLRDALSRLSQRERRAVVLSYFGELSQTTIAGYLGCSQMQVSRIIRAALDRMHAEFTDEE